MLFTFFYPAAFSSRLCQLPPHLINYPSPTYYCLPLYSLLSYTHISFSLPISKIYYLFLHFHIWIRLLSLPYCHSIFFLCTMVLMLPVFSHTFYYILTLSLRYFILTLYRAHSLYHFHFYLLLSFFSILLF